MTLLKLFFFSLAGLFFGLWQQHVAAGAALLFLLVSWDAIREDDLR